MNREKLLKFAIQVFNKETDKLSSWLLRPNKALGNRAPNDLLETEENRKEVELILNKLEYGIFS